MKSGNIPAPTVQRLSLYLRELEGLWRADRTTVSSRQLGSALRLTDTQVRKDLAFFGQFGHPGIGYDIPALIARIKRILGTDHTWNALLVGAGHLGLALSAYRGFAKKGFRLVAVFDNDPAKIGQPVPSLGGVRIHALSQMKTVVKAKDIRLAIIAVPAEAAQEVADRVVASGIRGILNFAPTSLHVKPGVAVTAVDLAVQLEQLSFQVSAAALGP